MRLRDLGITIGRLAPGPNNAITDVPGVLSSGDIILCFSTATRVPAAQAAPHQATMLPSRQIDPLFEAVVEAVEEAILNALCAAETMTGRDGRTAYAPPHGRLVNLMGQRNG